MTIFSAIRMNRINDGSIVYPTQLGFMLLLIVANGLFAHVEAHEGSTKQTNACVSPIDIDRSVSPNDNCSQQNFPGSWNPIHWDLKKVSGDRPDADNSAILPTGFNDNNAFEFHNTDTQLGNNTEANNNADASRIESRVEPGFQVDTQSQALVGTIPSNSTTRLTNNANENEDTLRSRVNSVTPFAIKADEHAGAGASLPAARLNFRSRQNEDPPSVSRQDISEPNDWLSVSREGKKRAGIFHIQNSINTLTDRNGKAIFTNTLNTNSPVPTPFARASGSGSTDNSDPGNAKLPSDNSGTGAPRPSHELVIPEDFPVLRIRGQF
jgi:hypothetical protein